MNAIKYKELAAITCFIWIGFSSIFPEHKCEAIEINNLMNHKNKQSFNGDWDENKAVEIVTDICRGWLSHEAKGGYEIRRSLYSYRNNTKKRLFQVSSKGESCHLCPGLIGAVVFSEKNRIWQVQFEEEHFAKFGCYGVPPEGKLLRIGPNRDGLLFQWWRSGIGGGYVHYVTIIDLGDSDYPMILQENIYQTDGSLDLIVPKLEISSTNEGEFHDVKLGSKIYHYENGKYKAFGVQLEKSSDENNRTTSNAMAKTIALYVGR